MLAIALFAGAILCSPTLSCGASPRGQRIVLITIDTLRYDRFAGGDGVPSSMPLTLAVSRRGLVFDRAHSATSSTQPSHATFFTALHPWQHGITRNGQILDSRFVTVAEVFKGAGFETAAVVASVPVQSQFGFAQGFDYYDETFSRPFGSGVWEGVRIDGERFYSLSEVVTDSALRRLDQARSDRQFFWFHYFDPHAPYGDTGGERTLDPLRILELAKTEARRVDESVRLARALYDLDVASMDRSLGRLFQRLERDGKRFETSVVFVSDHGESLGEEGIIGHGSRLNEEQIHVPLFILSPKVQPATRSDLAGSIDIAPTLLSLAGLRQALPGGRDLTAVGGAEERLFGMRRTYLRPTAELRLDGRASPQDALLFYVIDGGGRFSIGNSTRVVEGPPPGDLPDDPSRELLALFGSFEAELHGVQAPDAIDDETLRALRSLGYVN